MRAPLRHNSRSAVGSLVHYKPSTVARGTARWQAEDARCEFQFLYEHGASAGGLADLRKSMSPAEPRGEFSTTQVRPCPCNTKGYSSTHLAMGFANVQEGTRYSLRGLTAGGMPCVWVSFSSASSIPSEQLPEASSWRIIGQAGVGGGPRSD